MRRMTGWSAAAALAVSVACSSAVRPSFAPFPQATTDTVVAAPNVVIQEVAQAVIDEALQIQWNSPEEGYLETMWYNVISRESGVTDRSNPERIVRFRFWTDPVGTDRTKIVGEAVLQRTTDPSIVNPRDREMLVPPGHAGEQILNRIMQRVRERFGG